MTLTAYYDLHVSPASYDVVAFLQAAESWRIEREAERLRIEILPGPWGGFRDDRFWPRTLGERRQMLDCVVVPMCRMLPSADIVLRQDRPERRDTREAMGFMAPHYGLRIQAEMLRHGVRPLRPAVDRGPIFRFGGQQQLVTITLREAEHWPERNSNVAAWCAAALEIERRGYDVLIIRDTRRAAEELPGFLPHHEAALDLERRATLYRSAVCNMGVSNGPMWFTLALDAPVLMLKPTTENLMRTCTVEYFRACGIEPGGQIPGSPPYQQIVWAEDTTENILAAFDGFIAEQDRSAAA